MYCIVAVTACPSPSPSPQDILQHLLPDVEVEESKDYEEWLEVFVQEASKSSSVTNGPSTPSPDSSVSAPCSILKQTHPHRHTHMRAHAQAHM